MAYRKFENPEDLDLLYEAALKFDDNMSILSAYIHFLQGRNAELPPYKIENDLLTGSIYKYKRYLLQIINNTNLDEIENFMNLYNFNLNKMLRNLDKSCNIIKDKLNKKEKVNINIYKIDKIISKLLEIKGLAIVNTKKYEKEKK